MDDKKKQQHQAGEKNKLHRIENKSHTVKSSEVVNGAIVTANKKTSNNNITEKKRRSSKKEKGIC